MAKTIEIVNFRLRDGVTEDAFVEETKKMERDFLGRLPGFLDRDTGPSADGDWIVVLHWASPEDAQASMNKFEAAPETRPFMAMVDPASFRMTRYQLADHYQ